ncbi:MAG: GNAT family N-acetyltransferase [Acidimicrobiales bacterium]
MKVVEVDADATHDLRRRVLRGGRPDAEIHYAEDEHPEAFHLGVLDGEDRIVAVATWSPAPTPRRPGARAWRLRGMAVEPDVQSAGVGALLLVAAVERLEAAGVEVLWADGRDTALRFYERHGWVVEGDGYLSGPHDIPHHTVVRDLRARKE